MRRQLLGRFEFAIALLILVLVSAPHFMPVASAQTATPPSSTISSSINSSSGPLAWDFGPVGGGTFIDVDIQNICPPEITKNPHALRNPKWRQVPPSRDSIR